MFGSGGTNTNNRDIEIESHNSLGVTEYQLADPNVSFEQGLVDGNLRKGKKSNFGNLLQINELTTHSIHLVAHRGPGQRLWF